MVETIWTYRVKPERRAEFENRYAPDGDWARLLAQALGYRGTRLGHDVHDPQRYVTVDRWESPESLEEFKRKFAAQYKQLDRECAALTEREEHLGVFALSPD